MSAAAATNEAGGRRAATAAFAVAHFLLDVEARRTVLFRDWLRETVRSASPLAVAMAEREGLDMETVVRMISPPADWPWSPVAGSVPPVRCEWVWNGLRPPSGLKGSASNRRDALRFERWIAAAGVVVRGVGDPGGALGFRVVGDAICVTAGMGPCRLHAGRGLAHLAVPGMFPDTILAAMPGRPLATVVHHPLFRKSGWIVRDAHPFGSGTVLSFRTGLVPIAARDFPSKASGA